jgi:hypothetical protein
MPNPVFGGSVSSGCTWVGDLGPGTLGGAFHLFGVYRQAGQLCEQLTAFLETDHRTDDGDHAGYGWRKTGVL